MGGNNLPNVITSRKSTSDYIHIKSTLLKILQNNNIDCICPYEIPNKTDYGDLDIICVYPNFDILDFIKNTFQSIDIVPSYKDSKIINVSFNVTHIKDMENHNDFQIDLIFCDRHNMEMYMFYYSYGDVGGIIGRIVSSYGLKFGEKGLFMNYNSITNMPDTIILSSEPEKICNFIGANYDEWLNGFDTVEDIYKWLCNIKLFYKDIFKVMNKDHRDRVQKRPMYSNFLRYIDIDVDSIQHADVNKGEVVINKQTEAIEYFNKWDEVQKIKQIRLKEKERNQKYNAHIFIDRGYKGKEIGIIKKKFEEHIKSSMTIDDFIDSNTTEQIVQIIEEFLFNEL